MSQHFDDKAGWIAALSEDDPERIAASEHARGCSRCALALAEGTSMVALLDRLPPPPVPAAELDRLLAVVESQIAAEERRRNVTVAAAVVAVWMVELLVAKKLTTMPGAVGVSLLVLAIGAAVAGANRLGFKAAGLAVAMSAVLAVAMGNVPGLVPTIGVKCSLLELVAALVPWVVFLRSASAGVRRGEGAAVAAAGALAGHAALHLSCPVAHSDAHLLVFHYGGVLLAAALGALAIPSRRLAGRAG